MPFTNEIAGAQGSISRPQFKSPNYSPGVSGWALFRDGSSEFASGQFRGAVLIGTTPNPRISITTSIPAPLAAWSADFTFDAAIIEYFDATQFYFDAIGTFNGTGGPFPVRVVGAYDTVKGVQAHQINEGPGSAFTTFILGGSDTYNTEALSWQFRNGSVLYSHSCDGIFENYDPVLASNQFYTHGRGTVGVEYFTSGTGVTSTGATEKALPAWDSAPNTVRIEVGHFYSFHVTGGVFSSVNAFGELAEIKVRKTTNSVATQVLGDYRLLVNGNAAVTGFDFTFYVQNGTGSPIDIDPGITIRRAAGTGNHSLYGDVSTPLPLLIRIKDEGVASQTEIQGVATPVV